MPDSDEDLVRLVRQGSREASGELAKRHLRACRATALAILGDLMAAEDMCQDAFVYAMGHIDDCRDPRKFGGWLRQIVRSHARNFLRRPAHLRSTGLEAIEGRSDGSSAANEAERGELRERLMRALAEISEVRREIILLHDMEGWTHEEIGTLMNLRPGTVRSHLFYARRDMRRILGSSGVHA